MTGVGYREWQTGVQSGRALVILLLLFDDSEDDVGAEPLRRQSFQVVRRHVEDPIVPRARRGHQEPEPRVEAHEQAVLHQGDRRQFSDLLDAANLGDFLLQEARDAFAERHLRGRASAASAVQPHANDAVLDVDERDVPAIHADARPDAVLDDLQNPFEYDACSPEADAGAMLAQAPGPCVDGGFAAVLYCAG